MRSKSGIILLITSLLLSTVATALTHEDTRAQDTNLNVSASLSMKIEYSVAWTIEYQLDRRGSMTRFDVFISSRMTPTVWSSGYITIRNPTNHPIYVSRVWLEEYPNVTPYCSGNFIIEAGATRYCTFAFAKWAQTATVIVNGSLGTATATAYSNPDFRQSVTHKDQCHFFKLGPKELGRYCAPTNTRIVFYQPIGGVIV